MKFVFRVTGTFLITIASISLISRESNQNVNQPNVKNTAVNRLEKSNASSPIQLPNIFFMFAAGLE